MRSNAMKTPLVTISLYVALITPLIGAPRLSLQIDPGTGVVTCQEQKKACLEALTAAEEVIAAQHAIMEARARQVEAMARRIGELESKQDSIFRNPFVMLITGALIGGATVGIIQKF